MTTSHVKIIFQEGDSLGIDDDSIYVQVRESVLSANGTEYRDYILEKRVAIDGTQVVHSVDLIPGIRLISNYARLHRIGIKAFDDLLEGHPNKDEIIKRNSYLAESGGGADGSRPVYCKAKVK